MRSLSKSLAVLVASLAIFASPTASGALVFGHDDRQFVSNDPSSLYAPIGIVYGTPEARYATAFLIDDCHALTVQHAFGSSRSAIGRQAVFAANVRGSASSWRTSIATVVAEGALQRSNPRDDRISIRATDWTLLRLRQCLGRKFGHVTLTGNLPKVGEPIAMAGYPRDSALADGLVVDPSCEIREARTDVLLHDCAVLPGNSGSPLFRIVSDGRHARLQVFAIVAAGHYFGGPGADLAGPVHEYAPYVASVAAPVRGFANGRAAVARIMNIETRENGASNG